MERVIVSPKNSSLAFDDVKEQNLDECFVPELNVIVSVRHQVNNISFAADNIMAAVEVKGMFTVSF